MRSDFLLGLVAEPAHCARQLAGFRFPVEPLLDVSDLVSDALPADALYTIISTSIEQAIMREMVTDHGPGIRSVPLLLEALIHEGVRGGTVNSVARAIGVSRSTIGRWLQRFNLTPKKLLTEIRLRAYDLRVATGTRPNVAAAAGGWSNLDPMRKARRRLSSLGNEPPMTGRGGTLDSVQQDLSPAKRQPNTSTECLQSERRRHEFHTQGSSRFPDLGVDVLE